MPGRYDPRAGSLLPRSVVLSREMGSQSVPALLDKHHKKIQNYSESHVSHGIYHVNIVAMVISQKPEIYQEH